VHLFIPTLSEAKGRDPALAWFELGPARSLTEFTLSGANGIGLTPHPKARVIFVGAASGIDQAAARGRDV
jgi:hypothetical protein